MAAILSRGRWDKVLPVSNWSIEALYWQAMIPIFQNHGTFSYWLFCFLAQRKTRLLGILHWFWRNILLIAENQQTTGYIMNQLPLSQSQC